MTATMTAPERDTALRPFQSMSRKPTSPTCASASRPRGGPSARPCRDATQGVQLATVQELAQLLGDGLRLAQVRGPNSTRCRKFITEIDGLDIHFIHVRSKHRRTRCR